MNQHTYIPTDPTDRRDWVVSQLRRRGLSLRKIAGSLGISPQSVSKALFLPSARVERALADALAVQVGQLFPERYDRAGTRICQTRDLPAEAA